MLIKKIRGGKTILEVRLDETDEVPYAIAEVCDPKASTMHSAIKNFEKKLMDVGPGSPKAMYMQRQINILNNMIKIFFGEEGQVVITH